MRERTKSARKKMIHDLLESGLIDFLVIPHTSCVGCSSNLLSFVIKCLTRFRGNQSYLKRGAVR